MDAAPKKRPLLGPRWLALAALLVATPAYAQEAPFEDTELLFFGEDTLSLATRSPEPARTAPSVALVVTREEIRERGLETLGELLSTVPGFYVEPDERRLHVLTRGMTDAVLLMVDGVPGSLTPTGRTWCSTTVWTSRTSPVSRCCAGRARRSGGRARLRG